MHISINGPPLHTKEADALISRVAEQYALGHHRKVPRLFSERSDSTSASTQTEVIVDVELVEENQLPNELESSLDAMNRDEVLNSNFEYDESSSEGSSSHDDDENDALWLSLY